MRKRYVLSLRDILESMQRISSYIQGVNFDSFSRNQMLIDAVIRNLEIIGEAARNVPEDIRQKFNEIPWRTMIGLRNILIHEYFGVDDSIIWEIINTDLPEIKPHIIKSIEDEEYS